MLSIVKAMSREIRKIYKSIHIFRNQCWSVDCLLVYFCCCYCSFKGCWKFFLVALQFFQLTLLCWLGAVMLTLHLSVELQMADVTQAIEFKTGRRRLLLWDAYTFLNANCLFPKILRRLVHLQLGFIFMHH